MYYIFHMVCLVDINTCSNCPLDKTASKFLFLWHWAACLFFFLLCKLELLSLSLGFSSDQHLLRTLASKLKLNFYKTLNWHEIVSIKYVDSLSTRRFIFLYLYPHGKSFLVYIVSIPVLLWHFLIVQKFAVQCHLLVTSPWVLDDEISATVHKNRNIYRCLKRW